MLLRSDAQLQTDSCCLRLTPFAAAAARRSRCATAA